MSDTDGDNDKTQEISERLGDSGAVGGNTDSDDSTVLTLDSDSGSADSEGESEGVHGGDDPQ